MGAPPASIKDGAATIAYGLMKYYTGNNTGDVPGNLPDPYYCMLLARLALVRSCH